MTPTPTNIDLTGKVIIVTGANAGLGFETSRQFLALKVSKVILAVRNLSKGEAARQRLLADEAVQKHNLKADVKVMELDMERYESVVAYADQVKKELPIPHLVLLNAGIGQLGFETSPTGHEKVTQVNYLSNALLALELLPLLEATAEKTGAPTRISWVGSRMHLSNSLAKKQPLLPGESVLEHFDDRSKYLAVAHYGDTKLLCFMFVQELAKRVSKDKVIVNTMCPGMVDTNMTEVLPIYFRVIIIAVKKTRARTSEQGGWILVHAAAVVGPESHGRYLNDKDIVPDP